MKKKKKKKKLKSSSVKTFERGKKSENLLALPRNYWNKTNIYDYQIEKYKRKIGYLQENNP